jgi:RNA polymerase sigma-70 factor (ECF subfamily)
MTDSEHFTRLWTQAQPLVSNYIGTLVPDFTAAEDLLQSVAVACMRKFDRYDRHRPFVAWAFGIARFEVLHWQRSRARNPLIFDDSLMEEVAEVCQELAPELERRTSALRECLQRLEERALDLLRLRYDEELRPEAIAQRLQVAAVAVRVRLSRARQLLRDCIELRLRRDLF